MRALLVCLVLAAAAASASAQDTQQDIAEKIVRDAEQQRRTSVERAIGAPAKAFDKIERSPPPAQPLAKAADEFRIPWTPIVGVGALLVGALAFRTLWRWAGKQA